MCSYDTQYNGLTNTGILVQNLFIWHAVQWTNKYLYTSTKFVHDTQYNGLTNTGILVQNVFIWHTVQWTNKYWYTSTIFTIIQGILILMYTYIQLLKENMLYLRIGILRQIKGHKSSSSHDKHRSFGPRPVKLCSDQSVFIYNYVTIKYLIWTNKIKFWLRGLIKDEKMVKPNILLCLYFMVPDIVYKYKWFV